MDGSSVGAFSVRDAVHGFVGAAEFAVCVSVEGIDFEGALKLGDGLLVAAARNESHALIDVSGAQAVAELDGARVGVAGQFEPFGALGTIEVSPEAMPNPA